MNDLMLYIMVASIFGMFGWAAFEYAKAGYQSWTEQRQTPNRSETPEGATTSQSASWERGEDLEEDYYVSKVLNRESGVGHQLGCQGCLRMLLKADVSFAGPSGHAAVRGVTAVGLHQM